MPIYAYKCASCGHAQDVLQKLSDAPLSVCPQCGAASYQKQLTAAGFQLKGSGWYVTDFRGGNTAAGAPEAKPDENASAASAEPKAAPAGGAPATSTAPAAAATPSASGGSSAPAAATTTKPTSGAAS